MDSIEAIRIIEQHVIRAREGLKLVSVIEMDTTIERGVVTFGHSLFFEPRSENLSDRSYFDNQGLSFPAKVRRVLIDFNGYPQALDDCPIFAVWINNEWQAVGTWSHFGTLITG